MTGLRRLIVRGLVVLALDWVGLMVLGALLSDFSVDGPAGALVHGGHRGGAQRPALADPQPPRAAAQRADPGRRGARAQRRARGHRRGDQPRRRRSTALDGRRRGGRASPSSPPRPRRCWPSTTTRRWQRNVVRRQARRAGAIAADVPGVVFLEIDGLAHEVLRRALRDGNAPMLARWLREGSHRLERWETDWSSQTGACQAGLLHGNNDDMPAFRWWEKDRGRAIVTNHPRDAAGARAPALRRPRPAARRRRQPRQHPLRRRAALAADHEHRARAPARIARARLRRLLRPPLRRRAHACCWRSPTSSASAARRARQRRDDVRPRIRRTRVLRARARVGDRGPARPPGRRRRRRHARRAARRLHDLPRLRRGRPPLGHRARRHAGGAARTSTARSRASRGRRDAPRPYELVVLSDHGQSQGATFRDRYGITLEDLVRAACETGRSSTRAPGGEDEALAYLGAGADRGRARRHRGRRARCATATRDRRAGGAVTLAPAARAEVGRGAHGRRALPEIVGHGLGLPGAHQLPARAGPRDARAAATSCTRGCCRALREHPGIGFVLVRSERARRRRPRRRAARTASTRAASRARTRSRRSARTPPTTCGAPTASRTAPTCSSTPSTGPRPRRSPRSRSSSARTAAWAAASHSRSSSSRSSSLPRPGGRGRRADAPRAAALARRARPRRLSRRAVDHRPPRRKFATSNEMTVTR